MVNPSPRHMINDGNPKYAAKVSHLELTPSFINPITTAIKNNPRNTMNKTDNDII